MAHPSELADDYTLEIAGVAVKPITRLVQISPLGSSADDWARLSDALTRYSGKAAIVMAPGLWTMAANSAFDCRGLISGIVTEVGASVGTVTLAEPSVVTLKTTTRAASIRLVASGECTANGGVDVDVTCAAIAAGDFVELQLKTFGTAADAFVKSVTAATKFVLASTADTGVYYYRVTRMV